MPKSNHMKCDICGDPMDVYFKSKWEIDRYSCYPCKHTVYASDAWRYDSPVRSYDGQPVMDYSLFVEE